MSRILLHILFWAVYFLQDAMLEFLWVGPALPGVPEDRRFAMALQAAVTIGIPKMLFAYFMMYVSVNRLLQGKAELWKEVARTAVVFLVVLLVYRLTYNYIIYPGIYEGLLKTKPLFAGGSVLMAIMDLGFVCGTAVTLHLLRIQLAGKEREKNLVKGKLETELKFLRNQINPHFLFNTLNNIYGLARKKSDHTAEIVMKLSKLLRFMLYETGKSSIPVCDEIRMLGDYLELEKIRYNKRLSITFNKEVDNGNYPVAPLLLLPFVENAFKHGVSESRMNAFVYIDLRLQKGVLSFLVENSKENGNGQAITDNIGLSNVRRQLELMYKDYKLDVQDQQQRFKVHLTINLDSHAKI
jgi:sensor histidine kinase YesM